MSASKFLLETEKNLFLKHFAGLTPVEIQFLAENFDSYHEAERVADAMSMERVMADVTAYFRNLN